jgi:dihydropyrimidinase
VTPEGVVRCDVAVAGETIAAIATPGTLSVDTAKHVIDATGHIVMPGGIDPHVHLHHSERGARRSTPVHFVREFA